MKDHVKGRRSTAALPAVTALLALAALGIWGVSMYCLTAVGAEYAASRYLSGYADFASAIFRYSRLELLGQGYDEEYANYDAGRVWEAADMGGRAESFAVLRPITAGNGGFLPLPESDRAFSAAAVYDGAGNLLACSWEDFFYFEYLTETQWQNREERSGNNARARFDRALLTEAGREMVREGLLDRGARALRFTGSFDGVDFTPRTIEAIDGDTFDETVRAMGGGSYTVSGVVQDNDLPWITLYENPQAAQEGESITLYSDWFDVCYHQPSPAFFYNAMAYDDVEGLVGALGPALADGTQMPASRYEGRDLILPSVNYCFTLNGETYCTPYYGGQAAYTEGSPQVHFYIVSAVYCSPWRTAGEELFIANPSDEVVDNIEYTERQLCNPPRATDVFKVKKISTVFADKPLVTAVQTFGESEKKTLVVYDHGKMAGVINSYYLYRLIAAKAGAGESITDYLKNTNCGDILDEKLLKKYLLFDKQATVFDVFDAFERRKDIYAVIITENGVLGEKVLLLLTPSDFPAINRYLEACNAKPY